MMVFFYTELHSTTPRGRQPLERDNPWYLLIFSTHYAASGIFSYYIGGELNLAVWQSIFATANFYPPICLQWQFGTQLPNLISANISGYTVCNIENLVTRLQFTLANASFSLSDNLHASIFLFNFSRCPTLTATTTTLVSNCPGRKTIISSLCGRTGGQVTPGSMQPWDSCRKRDGYICV